MTSLTRSQGAAGVLGEPEAGVMSTHGRGVSDSGACFDRLRNLILYVARQSEGDERFGSTKLNKELFYVDFTSYIRTGKSVTGAEYRRIERGPAPTAMKPVLDAMVREQELALESRGYFGFGQKVPRALREPDTSLFAADELALVHEILDRFHLFNGKQISKQAYQDFGLSDYSEGETLPYEIALVSNDGFTEREIRQAQAFEDELVANDRAGRPKSALGDHRVALFSRMCAQALRHPRRTYRSILSGRREKQARAQSLHRV